MTQVTFATSEANVPASKMNTAVQGRRFLRRSTFTGCDAVIYFRAHPRATAINAIAIGPGGGGGGVAGATFCAAGAGGGGGGYGNIFTVRDEILRSEMLITAPIGGAGGIAGGGNGGTTSNSVVSYINSVGVRRTVIGANRGSGGGFMATGTTVLLSTPGAGESGFADNITSRDAFFGTGEHGESGKRFTGSAGVGGAGGHSLYGGAGGNALFGNPGMDATSFGGGGGGGVSAPGASQPGGKGGDGLIILDEYY